MKNKIKYFKSNFQKEFREKRKERNKKSPSTWEKNKIKFRNFWKTIMNGESKLTNKKMDEVIKFLDVNARGRKKGEEAIAVVKTSQGRWHKVFKIIKANKELKNTLNKLFHSRKKEKEIQLLNEVEDICKKEDIKYIVTKTANLLNCLLFANNPKNNISIISLTDRYRLIEYFELAEISEIMNLSFGEKIIKTRDLIINLNKDFGFRTNRIMCNFFYFKPVQKEWKVVDIPERRPDIGEQINFRGFVYAPVNHEGVVALFGAVAKDLGFNIEKVRKEYPDIEAIYKGKRVNIEIEYLSSEFNHNPKKCDYIVCWKKSKEPCPVKKIVELKEEIKKLK